MSRVGNKLIALPDAVDVAIHGEKIVVAGPKGKLDRVIHPNVEVTIDGKTLSVRPKGGGGSNFQGLMRSLINNMVIGVTQGFTKTLLLKGVGYRSAVKGTELHLTLGYSHPVIFNIPKEVSVTADKIGSEPSVVVTGTDKEAVGQVAAVIRGFRKPEPYHGKGVRYSDEVIITKVGKSAGKKK